MCSSDLTTSIRLSNPLTFNNTGRVDVQSGTLSIGATGTHTGLFNVALGKTLNFSGDNSFTAETFQGGGTLTLSGGTQSFAGANVVTGTTLTVNGATLNGSGSIALDNASGLNLSSGVIGNASVTVGGAFNWSGSGASAISTGGGLTVNGGTTITGAGEKLVNGGVLILASDTSWDGAGRIQLGNSFGSLGGSITNQVTRTFEVSGDGTLANDIGGSGVFNNAGRFLKSGGLGTTSIRLSNPLTFNNTGRVDVQSGVLNVDASLTQIGRAHV